MPYLYLNTYCGLILVGSSVPRSHSLIPPQEMMQKIRKAKVRWLAGWDKGSLSGKAKAVNANKAKQRIHSPLLIVRQMFSHLQVSRTPSHITVTWEDKCHNSEHPTSSFPGFQCWAHNVVWDIPLVSQCQLSWLCPLPSFCAPSAYLLVGWCQEQERPWHCASSAQQ